MSPRTATPPPSTVDTPKRPITVRIASWSATNPWKAVLAWTLFVVLCFGAGTATGTKEASFADFWVGQAGQAESMAVENDIAAPPVAQILITSPTGALDTEAAASAAADLSEQMRALDEVAEVADPVTSDGGDAVLVSVTMSMPKHEAKEHIDLLLETTAAVQETHPGLDIVQTGSESISIELDESMSAKLAQVEKFTLPVTLAILFLVFGSLLLAGVPLALAITSIMAALGAYALSSYVFPNAGGAVVSVLTMIGMAVGVDYSLFYLKRVREERMRSGGTLSVAASIEAAAATAGRTILTAGIAVIASLAGLYLVGDVVFSSIATACIVVVAIAMISSLTVLPALLAKMGRRIDGGKLLRRNATAHQGESRMWSAMLRPSMKRPVATAVIGLILIVGLAAPALGMKLSVEGRETFPDSLQTIATYEAMTEAFPATGVSHLVVAEVDPSNADELAAAVAELEARTQESALFAETDQPRMRVSPDGSAVALELPVPYPTSDPRAAESLNLLRDELLPSIVGPVDGASYAVSGEPAYAADFSDLQASRLLVVLGFVLVATLIIMLITFRSWAVAILSTVLNLLSSLTAWGALVLVFQGTWAEGLLDFESPGFLGSRTPLMVFAILYGLSLDYQLFVMSRIKEAAERGLSPRDSIREGILSSASVVTSAAVIMMSVFVAFIFTDRIELKQLGFSLALGVLLDAVVVRVMLLPALMTVIERFGWWPKHWQTKGAVTAAGVSRPGSPEPLSPALQ